MTEVHSREALRLGIHPGAVILRVAGYDVAGRGRGGVQEAIGLSHDSFETEFVMEIGGEAPGPAVTEEEQKAATVLQSRFRGHRVRQQAAQRQYETARAQQLGLGEGLWGGIRYEWGTDRHETLLDRLESIERSIHRQGADALAAGGQRAARMRERAPIAAGREGSSTYWDSRKALDFWRRFLVPGVKTEKTNRKECGMFSAQQVPGNGRSPTACSAAAGSRATRVRREWRDGTGKCCRARSWLRGTAARRRLRGAEANSDRPGAERQARERQRSDSGARDAHCQRVLQR